MHAVAETNKKQKRYVNSYVNFFAKYKKRNPFQHSIKTDVPRMKWVTHKRKK